MKRLFFSTLLTLVPISWALADSVEIRQKYKIGSRYLQQVTVTQESSVSTGQTNSSTKTNVAFDLESTASAHNEDSKRGVSVAVRYTKIAMSVDHNGLQFRADSTGEVDTKTVGPLHMIPGIVGRGYTALIDENGTVQSVNEAVPFVNLLSANLGPQTIRTYRDLFSPEAIKQLIDRTTLRSPKGVGLKPGESWPLSQEIPMPGLGKLLVSGTYKFVKMTDFEGSQCAEIAVSATIGIVPPGPAQLDLSDGDGFNTLSRQMRLKINDSTMTGTIFFDPAISFPRGLNISQALTIDAKVPDGTNDAIKMPMKQSISVKLVEMADVVPQ